MLCRYNHGLTRKKKKPERWENPACGFNFDPAPFGLLLHHINEYWSFDHIIMSTYTFSLVHIGLEQIFQHYTPMRIDFFGILPGLLESPFAFTLRRKQCCCETVIAYFQKANFQVQLLKVYSNFNLCNLRLYYMQIKISLNASSQSVNYSKRCFEFRLEPLIHYV